MGKKKIMKAENPPPPPFTILMVRPLKGHNHIFVKPVKIRSIHPKVELAVGVNFGLLWVHPTLISVSKSMNRHYLFTFRIIHELHHGS